LGFEGWKTKGVKKRSCGEGYASPHAHGYSSNAVATRRADQATQEPGRGAIEATITSSAELAKIQQSDFERWGPIIKVSGFKPDP
jgi:hypothetical protein